MKVKTVNQNPTLGTLGRECTLPYPWISRLCDRQRVVKDVRMSRRALWRRADTVAAGYPLHLQQYVRLLALSLTGSLDLAPKYPWINSKRFCGLDWPVERGFTMRGLVRLKLGVLKSMFL